MAITKKEAASFKTKGVSLEVEIDEETVTSGLLDKLITALSGFFTQEAVDDLAEDAQEIKDYIGPEAGSSGFMMSKSLNDELMQALFIVLEPNTVDLHGDIYTEREVSKACHSFNTECEKAYLDHRVETSDAVFVESYIAPSDLEINGESVKKGTWLANVQFNETLWPDVKSGKYNGLSIGCFATSTELI